MTVTDKARSVYTFRPATVDDLPVCAAIWRIASNDYLPRRGEPEIPDDLAAVIRLYGHLQRTDGDGFVVAEDPSRPADHPGTGSIVGFAATVRRLHLWFLSMLFVLPEAQGRGLGRTLLARVAPHDDGRREPATARATATDSAQPISNALYASLGIVPRITLLRLVGRPDRPAALPALPDRVEAIPFEEIEADSAGAQSPGLGSAALASEIAAIDRDTLGLEHPEDHAFVRLEARRGFLFRDAGGASVGYGYTSESGRVGPVAVREAALLAPIVGHLVTCVEPRGAFGVWLPGPAGDAIVALLRAGLRLDGLPVLLCWDRPFADFSRYLPISPGLL